MVWGAGVEGGFDVLGDAFEGAGGEEAEEGHGWQPVFDAAKDRDEGHGKDEQRGKGVAEEEEGVAVERGEAEGRFGEIFGAGNGLVTGIVENAIG